MSSLFISNSFFYSKKKRNFKQCLKEFYAQFLSIAFNLGFLVASFHRSRPAFYVSGFLSLLCVLVMLVLPFIFYLAHFHVLGVLKISLVLVFLFFWSLGFISIELDNF